MKITKLLFWGAVGYFGYKWLKGKSVIGGVPVDAARTAQACDQPGAADYLATIADIYGMQVQHIGCRVPDAQNRMGGVEVFDARNGAPMIWVADGDLNKAAVHASTAVAEAGGNLYYGDTPYSGSVYLVG